jgi:hypothetical protein
MLVEKFRVGLIYKVTNKLSKKAYVGKTVKTKVQRWAEHVYAAMHGILSLTQRKKR